MSGDGTFPTGFRARLARALPAVAPSTPEPGHQAPGPPRSWFDRTAAVRLPAAASVTAPPGTVTAAGPARVDPAVPATVPADGTLPALGDPETGRARQGAAERLERPEREPDPRRQLPRALVATIAELDIAATVVSAGGVVLTANRAALTLGVARRGRLQVGELLEAVRTALADGVAREVAVRAGWLGRQRPDGAGPPLAARVRPLTGTEVPDAVLLLVEDRSQALRALAARQDFVVNVSHELKTPVGAISLLAEALQEAADDPEAVTRFARRIAVESRRLTRLVKEIVELSRVQLDDPVEHAETVSLAEVVAAAIDTVGVDADSRAISIESFVPPVLAVPGNRHDLISAVANLVGNAVTYSPPDTRVTVSATQVGEPGRPMVDLAVSDQGLGIAEDKLTRIFERFYRVDEARSRATGGTGLGLSIVKHVATGHGGSIRVWSVPGTGSTFTLRLPLTRPQPEGPPA